MLFRSSPARMIGSLASLALAVLLAAPVRAQVFDVIELRSLGGSTTKAFAINSAGVIVGMSTAGGPGQAVRWTNLAIESLGSLGGTLSEAYAVNASGVVVGYATDAGGHPRAFLNAGAGMQNLGTLGGASSIARGIDDRGDVVGNSDLSTPGVTHAFLRHTDGVMDDLGTFPGGEDSYAFAVTDSGRVVGWSQTQAGNTHGFLRIPGYSLVDMQTLGGSNSYLYALRHGLGYVMAGSAQTAGNVQQQACVWDEQARVRILGTLGGSFGEGYAISARQEVVGASTTELAICTRSTGPATARSST
jgi:probable HAF family extracellular repeat protein